MKYNSTTVILFCLIGLLAGNAGSAEIERPEATLNFAYATVLGTGAYKVGERSVYILNTPFFADLRETSGEDWGLELLLPVTLGVHNFHLRDIVEDVLSDRIETFGFSPGLEVSVPMNEHWMIKPYGHVGYTADLHDDNDAWTYVGGVKSLSSYPIDRLTVSLGGSVTLAGQTAVSGGENSGFGLLSLGVDVRHPLGLRLKDRMLEGSVYVIASRYFNELEFLEIGDEEFNIEQTLEIGMTLGTRRPVKFLGVDWQRVGMGFVFGDDLEAVSFNLGFPF